MFLPEPAVIDRAYHNKQGVLQQKDHMDLTWTTMCASALKRLLSDPQLLDWTGGRGPSCRNCFCFCCWRASRHAHVHVRGGGGGGCLLSHLSHCPQWFVQCISPVGPVNRDGLALDLVCPTAYTHRVTYTQQTTNRADHQQKQVFSVTSNQ